MSWLRLFQIGVGAIAAGLPAMGQIPKFDVATIKANQTATFNLNPPGVYEGTFRAENQSLKTLLSLAYGVQTFRITGPGFLNSDRFDVVAKLPEGVAENQWPSMLEALLTERFKIAIHRESKEMPVYEMVAAKGGLKQPYDKSKRPKSTGELGGLFMDGESTMSQLGDNLARWAGGPVVDKTGREGNFYYFLNFDPRLNAGGALTGTPDLFTAMQEQLGIKLEAAKASLDMIVIDRMEQVPGEN